MINAPELQYRGAGSDNWPDRLAKNASFAKRQQENPDIKHQFFAVNQ